MNNFDDLLGGGNGSQHFLANRPWFDGSDKILGHWQGDIGLKQGNTDFA